MPTRPSIGTVPRTRRGLRVSLCLAFLLALAPTLARAAGAVEVSADGTAAWLLRADGTIERIDLATRRSSLVPAPAGITAIALTGDARTLYALTPALDAKSTRLLALAPDTGKEISHRNLKGAGRMLVVTTDGTYICVVGQKGGARSLGGGDWTLTVVDAVTGKVSGPVALGVEPLSIALRDETGAGRAGARLLVATHDRIATYLLDPPASSWFYRSPGENRAVEALDGSPLVGALRDDGIALFDPRRQPRENGRVQLTGDDAVMTIPLDTPGGAAVITPDGTTVARLRADGAGLSLYDTLDGSLAGMRPVDDAPDLLASRVTAGPDRVARIVAASSLTGRIALVDYPLPPPRGEPDPARPGPPAPKPEPGPVAAEPAAPASPPESLESPESPGVEEPPASPEPPGAPPVRQRPPEPAPPEPAPPEPREEPAPPPAAKPKPAAAGSPVEPAPRPPAPPAPEPEPEPPPEPGPTRVSSRAVLMGRVGGVGTAAPVVLLYGPGNILKLQARAEVGADGVFSFPMPPAGTYRVLVSSGTGGYLFASPQYRTLVITEEQIAEGKGIEGIDFVVRGRL